MVRDSDRARVYRAEEEAFEHTLYTEPLGPGLLLQLARALFAHPWWNNVCGIAPSVVPTRADSRSSLAVNEADTPTIRVAPGHDHAHMLAHEAAHILAWRYHPDSAGHGREFRRSHLDVARMVNGSAAEADLIRAYAKGNLPVATRSWVGPTDEGERGLFGRVRLEHLLQLLRD